MWTISIFFKFWKGNATLNLLINVTRGTVMIFVTQTNTGTMMKCVPQEQMVGVRSYPSRELISSLFRVCHVHVV